MTDHPIDHRVAKWKGWCETTINNNVLTMYPQRYAWREVVKILEDNAEQLPESYWWEFMRETYATTQAVAVRRQADTHRDVASLGKLIQEIRDDASRITREFWLGLWNDPADPMERQFAERAWEEQYAGGVGAHLDPLIPTVDLEALTNGAASVRRYVNQHVAHAQAVPAKVTLTLDDVHAAIDVIGDLFEKYSNLLTAASYVQLEAVIQHDWKAAFRMPWMSADAPDELRSP